MPLTSATMARPLPGTRTAAPCLRAELDAFFARAYGLDARRTALHPRPRRRSGPDYPSETFRVLKEKEMRRYGEYRTARLVLDAWDRMERGS